MSSINPPTIKPPSLHTPTAPSGSSPTTSQTPPSPAFTDQYDPANPQARLKQKINQDILPADGAEKPSGHGRPAKPAGGPSGPSASDNP